MKLYNTFTGGAMNKDLEVRIFPKNYYLDAKNVRISSAGNQNSRSVKLPLGNTVKTAISFEGTGATCIGSCVDNFRNLVYYAVATSTHSYIIEYDVAGETTRTIVDDDNNSTGVFLFTTSMYVEMRVINDSENGNNYLVLTDGVNEPKFFEIDTVQALAADSYTFADVSLIKAPPTAAPSITLNNTGAAGENNLDSKFLSFAYRYKYQNGEWSALSPFSEFAFMPEGFSYNYKAGTNDSMFNNFAKADIAMNTGGTNVSDLQLIVKESGSTTAYIVDTYNKSKEGWASSATETVTFDNSRIYKALDPNQLSRVYDNVPIAASTLEVLGNRVIFGNYLDGYDLTYSGTPIDTQLTLSYISAAGTSGVAHEQVKTNRDYEIAIAYGDGKGRFTTPLVSDANTVYVPYSVADEKVQLRLTIGSGSRPPDWATEFRLFVKQSKTDYDVIAPVIFYRDGIYAWVKLEGNDVQKVGEGDFLYVKSDTDSLKVTPIRTKVLEIAVKDENFLEDTPPSPYEILQEAGTYMRLQVDGYALSTTAVEVFTDIGYAFRSNTNENNIAGAVTYIEDIFFLGSGLDDISVAGTFTGSADIRFEIEIDGNGAPDTFTWRKWDVSVDPNGEAYVVQATGQSLTSGSFSIGNGLTISWLSTTGHSIGDKWYISAKSSTRVNDWDENNAGGGDDGTRAIMSYKSKTPPDEGIRAGANITITYDDAGSVSSGIQNPQGFISLSLSSSRNYPNIEEWFYGDNIISQMGNIVSETNKVMFRRGTLSAGDTGREKLTVTGNSTHPMIMAILSPVWDSSDGRIRIDISLEITEFDNNIIFETIPPDITTDIFYELPYSYSITNGNHTPGGTDTNQVFGVTAAVITLPYFNSFGWYNGFESYKIGDTFNEKKMVLDTKPLIPIDNYQQVQRIAGLTYSGVYEATTQFNALNEFNLALGNYKDMDIRYGPIRKLHAADTDLVVFQHDKTHRVLFNKSVLYNADGSGNVSQNLNVLGQEVAYTGEYGICDHPESFAFFGNRIYHTDKDRGALMRLSIDGYTEISQEGLSDYFRGLTNQTNFVGGYDPYNDEYLVNLVPDSSPLTLAFAEGVGFPAFYEFEPERLLGINNRLYSIKDGQVWLHDDNTTRNNFYGVQRTASLTTVFNDQPQDVKTFRSVNLESSNEWAVALTSNFATGTIATTEFVESEEEFYAYIRQNETSGIDIQGFANSVGGIGEIASIDTLTLTMNVPELPRALAIGDVIWKDDGDDTVTVSGTVTAVNRTALTITLDSVAGLSPTNFIMFAKDARVEGGAFKGYYLQTVLTNSSTDDQELFAVKVEASRSSD